MLPAGISGRSRTDLARVLAAGRRFIKPADVVSSLGVDAETATKKLARWAEDGWVRRVRRGLYIGVPVEATNPGAWSEDALLVASEIWAPCYFTGWTAARHWTLTEQVFRTTVLKTTARVRTSPIRVLDHEYLVSHISDDGLTWGLKTEWVDRNPPPVRRPGARGHRHSRHPKARRRDPPCRGNSDRVSRRPRLAPTHRVRGSPRKPCRVQAPRLPHRKTRTRPQRSHISVPRAIVVRHLRS